MENIYQENIAETLAKELKAPIEIFSDPVNGVRRIAIPFGWTTQQFDDEKLLEQPRRKIASPRFSEAKSFTDYMVMHSTANTTIWVNAEFNSAKIEIVGIINDHGPHESESGWRDHLAFYSPKISEEWTRWKGADKKPMSQAEFASFIEDNLLDIVGGENLPSGNDMLKMAIDFEAKQDMRFKSALRLQSGGVDLSFVQQDDAGTIEKMKLFDRFSIGVPVFLGEDPYRVDSRLRYRVRESKLTFWYEIIRPDRVVEAASKAIIEKIAASGITTYHGKPFSS